jgi:hypothetical protein
MIIDNSCHFPAIDYVGLLVLEAVATKILSWVYSRRKIIERLESKKGASTKGSRLYRIETIHDRVMENSAELPSVELTLESRAVTYRTQTLRGNSCLELAASSLGRESFDFRGTALLRDPSSKPAYLILLSEPINQQDQQ